MRKIEIVIEGGAAPDPTGFDAAVIGRGDFDIVGGTCVGELCGDVLFQDRLIALHDKVIMGLPGDQVGGQGPLGQQRIYSDVFAGDIASFQYRDRHADFISAFDGITMRYG